MRRRASHVNQEIDTWAHDVDHTGNYYRAELELNLSPSQAADNKSLLAASDRHGSHVLASSVYEFRPIRATGNVRFGHAVNINRCDPVARLRQVLAYASCAERPCARNQLTQAKFDA